MVIGAVASVIVIALDLTLIYTANHRKKENTSVQWHLKSGYADYLE